MLLVVTGCTPAEHTTEPTSIAGTQVVSADGDALGTLSLSSSCIPDAHTELERGLALVHHMNYVEAEPYFRAALEADPECALGYWGVALTYVHPVWPDSVSPELRAAGEELLRKADAAGHKDELEAAYVAALAAYYDGENRSERERLTSYLDGWAAVHAGHPDDVEAAVFHALVMTAVGQATIEDKSYQRQAKAGEILEGVLARLPGHPGAHHYTIHAYDYPPLAEQALDIARRYGDLAPENTHALHMTSHIFTRLGLWPESIAFNTRAAAAAEQRTAEGEVSLHHLHALDYLAYAYLQQANDDAANAVATKLQELSPPFQNHSASAYTFAAIPSRLALERHDWQRAVGVAPRSPAEFDWDRYPYLEAIPYFARALGAAHTGATADAGRAISELERLEAAARALDIAYDWGIQVAIQRVAAQSWVAYQAGRIEEGLELAREAAEMEGLTEKNPVTPGEVLPARELYGDMLLAAGRNAEAIAAYEAALERSPNRFNSLFGAGRAAELMGDTARATELYRRLLEVCSGPTGARSELEHARMFVDAATHA